MFTLGTTFIATLTKDTGGYVYPQTILVTGTETIIQPSCVQFNLYYTNGASFGVRVPKCVHTAADDGLLLYLVGNGLGDVWHTVWLPLNVAAGFGDKCDVQLQFEAVYDTKLGLGQKTALGDVFVKSSECFGV